AIGRQSDRRQSLALLQESIYQFAGDVLRIRSRAPVAEQQKLASRLEGADDHFGGLLNFAGVHFKKTPLRLKTIGDDGCDAISHDELLGKFSRSLRSLSRPLASLFNRK